MARMSAVPGPLSASPDLVKTLEAYRTCEFVTLGRDGMPMAWPTAGIVCGDGTFLLTTSLGYPQKAFNVRRDARVALLFSDPTASGLEQAEQILVRGEAVCPDEVHTDPVDDLGAFWQRIFERQPESRRYLDWPMNRLTDFYFIRLLIRITPTEVASRPLPVTGAAGPVTAVPGLIGGDVLAAYSSAVLSARDGAGAVVMVRTTVAPSEGGYRVAVPDGVVVAGGPASLLVHRHDDKLSKLHNASVRGMLAEDEDGWLLRPDRLVEPGARNRAGLTDPLRIVRACRATTRRYLERRNLQRPQVPWPAYRAIRAAVDGR
jgi:hypothetical protein